MADLSDKDSTQLVRMVGSDSSGNETNYVDATANGLKVDGSAVVQPVAGDSASGAADTGNPVKTGAVYNATLPTVTSGHRINTQANQFGELAVVQRNKYFNVAGAATNTIKSGSGRLHCITVNATTNGTITVYDNTTATGTRIATCSISNGVSNPTLFYNVEFATGLTVVTTGANLNITVSYW